MIDIAFPVPKRKGNTLRDTFCCKTVGCNPEGRRYRYFSASCSGVVSTRHCGIDIGGAQSDDIVAVYDGRVVHVNFGPALGKHQFLIVDSSGRRWYYAHTRTRPANGLRVRKGQPVAKMGNESWWVDSSGVWHSYGIGTHLHFMVFANTDYRNSARNPITYLRHAQTA